MRSRPVRRCSREACRSDAGFGVGRSDREREPATPPLKNTVVPEPGYETFAPLDVIVRTGAVVSIFAMLDVPDVPTLPTLSVACSRYW